jgi:hypothetical protein
MDSSVMPAATQASYSFTSPSADTCTHSKQTRLSIDVASAQKGSQWNEDTKQDTRGSTCADQGQLLKPAVSFQEGKEQSAWVAAPENQLSCLQAIASALPLHWPSLLIQASSWPEVIEPLCLSTLFMPQP